jgi:hypothetical protein
MQVDPPLYGTGAVTGTSMDNKVVLYLTAPGMRITFDGLSTGGSIEGKYTVAYTGTTNVQNGTFVLHQDVTEVDAGFNPSNCPR